MPKGLGTAPSRRQQQINSYLQKKISEMISTGNFFGINGLVTVSHVETTPDLREAKVWISVFNQEPSEVLKILKEEIYHIQGQLFKEATMRIMPKIRFVTDHSGEYSDEIGKIIRSLKDDE